MSIFSLIIIDNDRFLWWLSAHVTNTRTDLAENIFIVNSFQQFYFVHLSLAEHTNTKTGAKTVER